MVKGPPANARDVSPIPGSGRSSGGGNGYPLQYSFLETPKNRGSWQAIVHGVAKERIRVEREVGGGIRMGNTCKSMADSCQCMTKTTTIL